MSQQILPQESGPAVFSLLEPAQGSDAQVIPVLNLHGCPSGNRPEQTVYFAYPWTSDTQRSSDYRFLEELYPEVLRALASVLNEIHSLSYEPRHWEITLGAWLGCSLSIVLDRLRILEAAQHAAGQAQVLINYDPQKNAEDSEDFIRKASVDDGWNLALMGKISRIFSKSGFKLEEKTELETPSASWGRPKPALKKSLGVLLQRHLSYCSDNLFGLIGKILRGEPTSLVWSAPYFSRTASWVLRADLGTSTAIRFFRSKKVHADASAIWRNSLKSKLAEHDDHENSFTERFLTLVPWLMPISFLEGFERQLFSARARNRTPRAIFTANSHFYDDHLKIWAASAVHEGSILAISEHGGFIKNPESTFGFEARIADQLVTPWRPTSPHETKLPIPGFVGKRLRRKEPNGNTLLIVASEIQRWAIRASAQPQSYRGLATLNDTAAFMENLKSPSLDKVIVKRQSRRPVWPEPWKRLDDFASKGLQFSYKPLHTELKRCRLTVCTYPETNYLEALLGGSPVILLCNPEVSGMDSSGQQVFEQMKQVGMAFQYPAKAADFVSENWGSIAQWWKSAEVTRVLETVSDYIALPQSKSLKDWTAFLGTLGSGRSRSARAVAD